MPKEALQPCDKIFAKVKGYPHWPCRINPLPPEVKIPSGKFPIFFYGTHEVYFLPRKEIFPFERFKDKFGSAKRPNHYNEGLVEIVQRPDTLLYRVDPKAEAFLAQFYKFQRTDDGAPYTPDLPVRVPEGFAHINSLTGSPQKQQSYKAVEGGTDKAGDASNSSDDAPLRSLKLKITLPTATSPAKSEPAAAAPESAAAVATPKQEAKARPQKRKLPTTPSSTTVAKRQRKPPHPPPQPQPPPPEPAASSESADSTDSSSSSASSSSEEGEAADDSDASGGGLKKRPAILDSDISDTEVAFVAASAAATAAVVAQQQSPTPPDEKRTNSMGRPMRASAQRFDVRKMLREDSAKRKQQQQEKQQQKPQNNHVSDDESDDESDDADLDFEAEKQRKQQKQSKQQEKPPPPKKSPPPPPPPPPPPLPPQQQQQQPSPAPSSSISDAARKEKLKQVKLEEKMKQKKLEKIRQLELEAKLRMMNADIKRSLVRGQEDFSRCLAILTEMQGMEIQLMMLAKYPDLTLTVRKCRKYKLSEKVRSAAQRLFDKFLELFESAPKEDVFKAEVEFLKYREACAHTAAAANLMLTSIQDLFARPPPVRKVQQTPQHQQQQLQQSSKSASAVASDHEEVSSSTFEPSTATAAAVSAPALQQLQPPPPPQQSPPPPSQEQVQQHNFLELDSLEVLDSYADDDEDQVDNDEGTMDVKMADADVDSRSPVAAVPGQQTDLKSRLRDLMGGNALIGGSASSSSSSRQRQPPQQQHPRSAGSGAASAQQPFTDDDCRIHDLLGI